MTDFLQFVMIFALIGAVGILYLKFIRFVEEVRNMNMDIVVLKNKEYTTSEKIDNLSKVIYDHTDSIRYLEAEVFGDDE